MQYVESIISSVTGCTCTYQNLVNNFVVIQKGLESVSTIEKVAKAAMFASSLCIGSLYLSDASSTKNPRKKIACTLVGCLGAGLTVAIAAVTVKRLFREGCLSLIQESAANAPSACQVFMGKILTIVY